MYAFIHVLYQWPQRIIFVQLQNLIIYSGYSMNCKYFEVFAYMYYILGFCKYYAKNNHCFWICWECMKYLFLVNFVRIYLPWWYWLITWNIYVWWFAKSVLKQWTACCDYVAESRWKESSLVTNATYIYHKKSISIF